MELSSESGDEAPAAVKFLLLPLLTSPCKADIRVNMRTQNKLLNTLTDTSLDVKVIALKKKDFHSCICGF